jgi:prevent-host-death family protein
LQETALSFNSFFAIGVFYCSLWILGVQCSCKKGETMAIAKVGTRELKSKLSEYMRRVKDGETILVTERGKPIGQIIPVKQTIQEKLQTVIEAGLADWNGNMVKPGKPVAVNRSEKQISDLVVEDRDVNHLP